MRYTLFDKIWEAHVVYRREGFPDVLYIDAHLIHEVTSPQAFDGLRARGIKVFRPERTWATADHNIPTKDQHLPIKNELSRIQVETLVKNCKEFGIRLYGIGHPFNGIVHVIGPQLGITKPGMTIVCGDSHTSTHGAFGALAFGIGTSEVEQVLASQCVLKYKPKKMRITINGRLQKGVYAKDVILYIISQLGVGGGTSHFVEYAGETIKNLSMEERMTICNMSIEMGARGGIVAPDEKTFEYLKGREFAPKGEEWDRAVEFWKTLKTDEGAEFDTEHEFDVSNLEPMITYGTNPGQAIPITGRIPKPSDFKDKVERESFIKALKYMGFEPGERMLGKKIDYVFIGSCTNARIEDLRLVAKLVKGKKKAPNVEVWVVPGSMQVKRQAEKEGLDKIFKDAGFDWRGPGCSACLGMNDDKIPAGKYCVSTSNRNYEGRQGPGARTILASPATAAACAIKGEIADVREIM